MAEAAFENITSRMAWFAGEALPKYYAAMHDTTTNKLKKATGAGPFIGIVEYGAEAADIMVTTVRGTYPGIVATGATVVAGNYLVIDSSHAGMFKPATTDDVAIGLALTGGAAGTTVAVQILETPFTVS